MHITGTLSEPTFSVDGSLRLVIKVNERDKALEEMQKLQDAKLSIDIEKFREKRSLDANAYLWQLIDKMAKAIKSDKWTIYLMELSKYGVFVDLQIKERALPTLEQHFRYVERLQEWMEDEPMVAVRAYYGSSEYDTKEMSELIDGTVQDAKDLGIETLTPDEIERMKAGWRKKE